MKLNWVRVGIMVFLVLTFLYAFLLANQVLVWFSLFSLLLAVYLVYLAIRLVRAVETIAENSNRPDTDTNE